MKLITVVLSLLLVGSIANSEQPLKTISWDKTKPGAGQAIPPSEKTPFAQVKITNSSTKPLTAHLITIENPGILVMTYAVRGQVRSEDVQGDGYLEMWSVFKDGSRFFTRTLGVGTLLPIRGTSGWHDLALPFTLQGRSDKPVRLEINLVLPGKGTVYIGPLTLVQSPDFFTNSKTIWWNNPKLYWLGPLTGMLSVVMALFAGLTFWLVPRGKARKLVRAGWFLLLGIGIAYMIVSRAAHMYGQPGEVYHTLLLTGVIFAVMSTVALIMTRKYYERWELRKMCAQDAGGR